MQNVQKEHVKSIAENLTCVNRPTESSNESICITIMVGSFIIEAIEQVTPASFVLRDAKRLRKGLDGC